MFQSTVRPTWLASIVVVFALLLTSAPYLLAQAPAEGAARSAPIDASNQSANSGSISNRNLFEILKEGGPMMAPLFACSFITLVFVLERAISLRRGRVIPRPFVKRFLHQVREAKLDREQALELCQENGSPVSDVFAATVKKWGRPSVELEQTIIDAGERVSGGLRRYIRLFNAAATISPLMGLLGTVYGMIRLFDAISTSDAMGRTEMLAAGISEALLCTAAGLLIAIPALCFYLLFVGRVERLLMEIDALGQELVGLISAESLHDERQAKARAKPRPAA
ncbi:MAG: MotA/TolQ/ExbB proton channel family protein [Planctomycetia bacterium]|nr:MotA/TolQ/ExbB proton channel family protein [Planctomycetia bacterium]